MNAGMLALSSFAIRRTPHADAWWVLNPDIVPDAGALTVLVARLNRGDCSTAGGILYGDDGAIQRAGGGGALGSLAPWLWRTSNHCRRRL
jgi:GT2 family glycosyltransferase